MGKGSIISHIGAGQYQVQLTLERTRVMSGIAALTARIAALTTKIAAMEDGQEKDIAILQKTALEKKKLLLDDAPENPTISAWCADLTTDLIGEVGTIEIPGERGVVQIQPGNAGNAAYSSTRDGQLQSAIASTPAGTFYNWAMLPGWQKWKPTFRVGVLSNLDVENDLCTITLDAAASSAQSLNVNQAFVLSSVPIEYMGCNAAAFANEDRVVVKFENQDWNTPKVIGFESYPKGCAILALIYGNPEEYLNITYTEGSPVFVPESVTCTDGGTGTITDVIGTKLYGLFIKCWSGTVTGAISGATATVNSAIESHYTRNYQYKEILGTSIIDGTAEKSFSGPLDQPPISDISAEGTPPSTECWSKTLDNLTVSAFIFYTGGMVSYATKKWALVAQYNDSQLRWDTWGWQFPPSGFSRCQYTAYGWTDTFIGFDLWMEAGEYYVGMLDDYARNYTYWKLNKETLRFEKQFQKKSSIGSHPLYHDSYTRLIGYGYKAGDHVAYWSALRYGNEYIQEDLLTGDMTTYERAGMIETALWNPFARTIKVVVEDDNIPGPTVVSSLGSTAIGHGCSAYFTSHPSEYCGTKSYTPSGWDQSVTVWGAKCSGDEEPDGWPQGFDSWSSGITRAWRTTYAVIDFGNFWVGEDEYDQGTIKNTLEEIRKITLKRYHGYCSAPNPTVLHDLGILAEYTCDPLDRVAYEFRGWIFGPNDEIAYRYADLQFHEETNFCNPNFPLLSDCVADCAERRGSCPSGCYAKDYEDTYWNCQCKEFDWQEKEVGPSDLRQFIDPTFPHDHTWRALLLHGYARTSETNGAPIERSNMAVYLSSNGLFLHDGADVSAVGNYARAFFQ